MDFWERLESTVDAKIERKRLMADIGVAPNSLTTWKKRRTYPAADVAVAIARALGVTVEWLVEGVDRSGLPPALVADLRLLADHAPERFDSLAHYAGVDAAEIRRRASAEAANGGISG